MITDERGTQSSNSHVSQAPLRILSVGPLPPPLGGTTVSFQQLQEYLDERLDVSAETINSFGVRGSGVQGLVLLVRMLLNIFRGARRADVVALHCSTTALYSFALIVLLLTRLAHRPIVIRRYGGADYFLFRPLKRKLAHFVVSHADLNLLESKKQVDLTRERGIERVVWYPTSRPFEIAEGDQPPRTTPCRRFVFLGQVNDTKGIREIIASDKRLGEDLSIDVYGPFRFGIVEKDFDGCQRVHYRGALSPDKVSSTLSAYDVLLLPTYYEGEGYPGVIVEAYGAGLPVICTRWKDIPEIVDESSGIFVEPRSVDALVSAMKLLAEDDAEFARLRSGALRKRGEFSLSYWADRFVAHCKQVAGVS